MLDQERNTVAVLGRFSQRIRGKAWRRQQAKKASDCASESQLSVHRRSKHANNSRKHDQGNCLVQQIKQEQSNRVVDDARQTYCLWRSLLRRNLSGRIHHAAAMFSTRPIEQAAKFSAIAKRSAVPQQLEKPRSIAR